jgi:hypothetical protein
MGEAKQGMRPEDYPVMKQAVLKALQHAAITNIPVGIVDDLEIGNDVFSMLGEILYLKIRGHVYGEHEVDLSTIVSIPVPEGRWAMFLWSITPSRWRPWLRKKLGIRQWEKRVGFERYRTYPSFIPAPSWMGGGRMGVVHIPIYESPNWKAMTDKPGRRI